VWSVEDVAVVRAAAIVRLDEILDGYRSSFDQRLRACAAASPLDFIALSVALFCARQHALEMLDCWLAQQRVH